MQRLRRTTLANPSRSAVCYLMVGLSLLARAGDLSYSIKESETLTEIATRFGSSVEQIVQRNRIQDPDKIYPGQRLIIPRDGPALDPELLKQLDQIHVTPGKWKYIVIHHSGSESGSARSFDRYHREHRHMENGLAYHFVIGNGNGMPDGAIAIGHRWKAQLDGGHLASEKLNRISIGICLVGNFDEDRPSEKQLRSLEALTEFLLDRCHLKLRAIRTHQQINPIYTRCPGRHFPARLVLREIKQARR